jgi:hypothetical protein
MNLSKETAMMILEDLINKFNSNVRSLRFYNELECLKIEAEIKIFQYYLLKF